MDQFKLLTLRTLYWNHSFDELPPQVKVAADLYLKRARVWGLWPQLISNAFDEALSQVQLLTPSSKETSLK